MENVPALRFSEFASTGSAQVLGEWEQKTLSDFMSFKNGVNADKSKYGSGTKFINVLDVIAEKPITFEQIIGSVEITDKEFQKNEVIFGDILFQRSSETREEVGQSNIYVDDSKSVTFGGFVIRGRPIVEFNPFYFNYLLKTSAVRKEITTRSGGSTRYNVGQATLGAVVITVTTNKKEQQKIATFLSTVDKKLGHLRRKYVLLETYKRGALRGLMQSGNGVRSLRFKNEQGNDFPDWEEKQLGDVGNFYGGGTPATSIKKYWNGNIPWVSSSDIADNDIHNISITRFITKEAIKESATKIVSANSILLVSRVGVGKLAVTLNDVCTSQDFSNFTPENDNIHFIAYYLLFNKNKLLSFSQGTSIKGFTTSDISSLKIHFPCKEEQQKIANFLSTLDKKLEAVESQIDQTEMFKKGLLQKMFV